MTPDQCKRVEELFDRLIELPTGRRAEELERQCPDDEEVRQEVTRLLRCADPTMSGGGEPTLLRNFLANAFPAGDAGTGPVPGSSIGPYLILEKLGEGGFGTVYKAEQRQPIRRTVALKVIKPGVDTKDVIARFNSERQALARMDHPNIAGVLDAGSTGIGRPYFVMEYVAGRAITRFCDENHLSIRDRLLLFVQVCNAITHAHQKAIIHRDIKSSNVLAYMHDGRPGAKVIDFGIAKALTSDRLTDLTLNTAQGTAIGTYESMSPEQAEGSPDIDTRTDVYALGVLLYDLLVGAPPFDREVIRGATETERRRIICEVEPPSPSARLLALGGEATHQARVRGCEVEALARQLQRELEWIPLKAMRKERERRYQSALSLATDIENYLQGRPLIAAPESGMYRLKKSLRRNAGLVSAVASVMVALILGIVGTTIQGIRATQAGQRTRDSEARALALADENGELARQRAAALDDANHQLGLASLEKARRLRADGDGFPSAMAAAFAIGFHQDTSGPAGVRTDPLLRRGTPAWREALDLSVMRDNTLLMWRSPAPVHHGGPVRRVAFSRDGTRLASASSDETLRVWDLATGQLLQTIDQHAGEISSVCFSPDGLTLAADSGASARGVRTWDIASGQAKLNLPGHQAEVRDVCYSADGKLIASASLDQTVRLWDAVSGELIWTCVGHSGAVTGVAFSPDGKTLASSSADTTIRLWDTAAKTFRVLKGSHGAVYDVSFSSDGNTLASASHDHSVCLWDLSTSEHRTLRGHTEAVTSVCFAPDGKTLASASLDRVARVWEVSTGTPIDTLPAGSQQVYGIRFSPDGRTLAWGSDDNRIHLRDRAGAQSLGRRGRQGDVVTSVSFSPDGRTIASASRDNTICLWDTATGSLQQTLQADPEPPASASRPFISVTFSPDGRTLAAAASDGRAIMMWDPSTAKPMRRLEGNKTSGSASSVGFSPDGKLLAAASGDNTIRIWDVAGTEPPRLLEGHGKQVTSVCFSPDGRMLASASDDNMIRVWDVATRESRVFEGHSREVTCVRFSPDGATLASASTDNTVRLWDVASGKPRPILGQHDLAVQSVSFSPDGRVVASASADKRIMLWDVATGRPMQIVRGTPEKVSAVVFSPDGTMLASAAHDGTVSLWSVASGRPRQSLRQHTDTVSSVCATPDGALLASGSYDSTVRLWDAKTGKPRPPLVGHTDDVYCVGLNASGTVLASGSLDCTVRLWDVATGKSIRKLTGVERAILSVAFSPDGTRLAAGSRDRSIHVWDTVTFEKLPSFEGHPDVVCALAYSPDGKILASGSRDPTIRLWDVASREARLLPTVHSDRVAGLSFSPQGDTLASGSYDHTVCLWDLKTGRTRWRAEAPGGSHAKNWITSVRFSPDGTTIASGAYDGVVRLWDSATGQLLQTMPASALPVFGVCFSPDGKTLACASNDHAIHLWDVRPNVPLRQYLRVYRFDGLDLKAMPAANLYGDGGFRAEALAAVPRLPLQVPTTHPSDQGTAK